MKHRLSIFVSIFVFAATVLVRGQTNSEVEARKTALDVAGAFSNEGFKIRDGHWCGMITPHNHVLIAVNLFAGNQYWFSAGAAEPATKIAVSVYDETGKRVTTEQYNTDEKAAAGFSPANSGQYFVSVELIDGQEGSFCLVYSYK
jgi:hypothetical protein